MKCEKCSTEYTVLRSEEGALYRNICACEVLNPCHKCKRNKINHVTLTRTGDTVEFGCKKHGVADAASWPAPGDAPEKKEPSAGRRVAEAMVDAKLKAKGQTLKPVTPSKPLHGVINEPLALRQARCGGCTIDVVTTRVEHCCPNCGKQMAMSAIENARIDYYGIEHGPNGTSLIVTGLFKGDPEARAVHTVHVEIPK